MNEKIREVVIKQINNYWDITDDMEFKKAINDAYAKWKICICALKNFDLQITELEVNPLHTVEYGVFLYYLSNTLKNVNDENASKVYYLNKIMNSVEWFYGVNLPDVFWAEHPIGSVLGKAKYGNYFFCYQGTTVGGNCDMEGRLCYPIIGNYVLMYANSTILGASTIGSHVIISANSYIINENIPDNSIVFGSSPNLVIIKKTNKEIKNRMKHIWNFET